MSILSFIKNWKDFSTIWAIIQPFILKLIKKKVPTTITKLYENLAKYTQPAIDSLFKLKGKIQNSPNELDDYCFNQGVNAIESRNSSSGYVTSIISFIALTCKFDNVKGNSKPAIFPAHSKLSLQSVQGFGILINV